MNKFLEKLARRNFKKIGIGFIILCLVALIGIGVTGYTNFGSRINDWEQEDKTDSDTTENETGSEANVEASDNNDESTAEYQDTDNEKDQSDNAAMQFEHRDGNEFDTQHKGEHEFEFDKMFYLNTLDKIIIGITGLILMLLIVGYWIIITLWMIRRAYLDEANYILFGFGAFFFNIAAVIVYLIYRSFTDRCPACGKIQKREAEYCVNCGTHLVGTCINCSAKVNNNDLFCGNCGHKR